MLFKPTPEYSRNYFGRSVMQISFSAVNPISEHDAIDRCTKTALSLVGVEVVHEILKGQSDGVTFFSEFLIQKLPGFLEKRLNQIAPLFEALTLSGRAQVLASIGENVMAPLLSKERDENRRIIGAQVAFRLRQLIEPKLLYTIRTQPSAHNPDRFYYICEHGNEVEIAYFAMFFHEGCQLSDRVQRSLDQCLIRRAQSGSPVATGLLELLHHEPYARHYTSHRALPAEVAEYLKLGFYRLLSRGIDDAAAMHYFFGVPSLKSALHDPRYHKALADGMRVHLESRDLEGITLYLGFLTAALQSCGLCLEEPGELESVRFQKRRRALSLFCNEHFGEDFTFTKTIAATRAALLEAFEQIEVGDFEEYLRTSSAARGLSLYFGPDVFHGSSATEIAVSSILSKLAKEEAPLSVFCSLLEQLPASRRHDLLIASNTRDDLIAMIERGLAKVAFFPLTRRVLRGVEMAKRDDAFLREIERAISMVDLPSQIIEHFETIRSWVPRQVHGVMETEEVELGYTFSFTSNTGSSVAFSQSFAEESSKLIKHNLFEQDLISAQGIANTSLEVVRKSMQQLDYRRTSAELHDLIAQTRVDGQQIIQYHREATLIRLQWLLPWDVDVAKGFNLYATALEMQSEEPTKVLGLVELLSAAAKQIYECKRYHSEAKNSQRAIALGDLKDLYQKIRAESASADPALAKLANSCALFINSRI